MSQLKTLQVEIPVKAIEALASSGLTNYISPDVPVRSFGHVTATTGADLVRTQSLTATLDGLGIGIAVLDSGIDSEHRSFDSNLRFSKDFTTENNPTADPYGHGSHVASAAAGNTRSGIAYEGIAPAAQIINLRVLNAQGLGTSSALLNALNWILSPADPGQPVSSANPSNQEKYNIRVVNMSLGAPAISSYKNDPICRAARALVDAGIVVVAAAGNNGKSVDGTKIYGQIHSPGNEPSVITVGAVNSFGTDARDDDGITSYSSRGPTRSSTTDASGVKHYDNLLKPDLVAPGNKLIYAEADTELGGVEPPGHAASGTGRRSLRPEQPSHDVYERNLNGSATRRRHCRSASASQSKAHPKHGQNDHDVYDAAFGWLQHARARHRRAER
jgi:hypothetical protein